MLKYRQYSTVHALRDDIMSLPQEERFDYALDIIDRITGRTPDIMSVLRAAKFTFAEAVMVATLNASAGRIVSKESLYTALYGGLDGPELKIIDVFVCKARKKLINLGPDCKIETCWGEGYSMAKSIDFENVQKSIPLHILQKAEEKLKITKHNTAWAATDIETVVSMHSNGSAVWAIAEELDRSQGSVQRKICELKIDRLPIK